MVTISRESNVNNECLVQFEIGEFVGIGFAEMSYLLARYSGDAVDKSREMLLLAAPQPEVTAAGASSLLARGWLRVNEDDLDLVGLPAVLAHTLRPRCDGRRSVWSPIRSTPWRSWTERFMCSLQTQRSLCSRECWAPSSCWSNLPGFRLLRPFSAWSSHF